MKKFSKNHQGNRNFCKILKVFLLPTVELSLFIRLYLRNGATWTPQTLHFLVKNFCCAASQPPLVCKNSRRELFSLGRKFIKYVNFIYCRNPFFNLVFSISLQRNVFRRSNFQLNGFKNYLSSNYWGINFW